jgi:hypothetical protein
MYGQWWVGKRWTPPEEGSPYHLERGGDFFEFASGQHVVRGLLALVDASEFAMPSIAWAPARGIVSVVESGAARGSVCTNSYRSGTGQLECHRGAGSGVCGMVCLGVTTAHGWTLEEGAAEFLPWRRTRAMDGHLDGRCP